MVDIQQLVEAQRILHDAFLESDPNYIVITKKMFMDLGGEESCWESIPIEDGFSEDVKLFYINNGWSSSRGEPQK